jgi:two-component system response regulator NreC
MPTVLLADDTELIRKAVRRILENEPTIKLIGEAEDFGEAIKKAIELKPDVLLLDLHMPDDRTLAAEYIKKHLRPLGSQVKIIGISLADNDDDDTRKLAESLGVYVVLDKGRFENELIPAILGCS